MDNDYVVFSIKYLAIMNKTLEEEIKEHHKDNPYFTTEEHIASLLDNAVEKVEQYQHDPPISMTISYRLQNGFTVLGRSAVVNHKKFDVGIGRKMCRLHAMNQLWQLEGYRLQCDMYKEQLRMEQENLAKRLG
jgi:hypothetical protein